MKYYKSFSSQNDPQKLAEMLAMQEANQRINTDYDAIPSMNFGQSSLDPMTLKRMKETMDKKKTEKIREIGPKTFDTIKPFDTGSLA